MHLDRSPEKLKEGRRCIKERAKLLVLIQQGHLLMHFKNGRLHKLTEQDIKKEIFEIEWAMATGLIWPTAITPTQLLEYQQ